MSLSLALTFCVCLLFTSVTRCAGESCSDSCQALADRVEALEAKWIVLGSLFLDESCPNDEPQLETQDQDDPHPEPEYLCYKGMADPKTPSRVPVKVLGDSAEALCDTETDGGGWIVIQRRADGVEDFYRDWETYKQGFDTVKGDYWLGNEATHSLTSSGTYEIRIDMKTSNGTEFYAHYSRFVVGDESSGYKLSIGGFSGDVPDSFDYHNNMKFSTSDRDNDVISSTDCAVICEAGWWFKSCRFVNLNGKWGTDIEGFSNYQKSVRWNGAHPQYGPYLSFTEMKIRPL